MKRRSTLPSHHRIDNTCAIDSEYVPFSGRDMLEDVKDDMTTRPMPYLSSHYPELVFSFVSGVDRDKPKGHLLTKRVCGGWRVADWRVA